MPSLTTTVTGLAASAYDVYVVYISHENTTSSGDIRASLNGGALTFFNGTQSGTVNDASGSDANWQFSLSKLGTTAVGSTGYSINVADGGGSGRTLYVGTAYTAVAPVPEPSSTALLGLGSLALILRRKK